MSVTPPEGPDRDDAVTPAGAAFDCPRCGRLRVRVDRPGNLVEYVCAECEPEGLPPELVRLAPG